MSKKDSQVVLPLLYVLALCAFVSTVQTALADDCSEFKCKCTDCYKLKNFDPPCRRTTVKACDLMNSVTKDGEKVDFSDQTQTTSIYKCTDCTEECTLNTRSNATGCADGVFLITVIIGKCTAS
jgi:hypothetical protein